MMQSVFNTQQVSHETAEVANVVEISVEEIEARENAASDTVYCCIVNVAF